MSSIRCLLKPGKEKPVLAHHPWIFSGALDQIDDGYKPGDLVQVYSSSEELLGLGFLNPDSQIAVRMLTFGASEIDESFFRARIRKSLELRKQFVPAGTNSYRLIHSESDFLPGLTVDLYGDYLSVQIHAIGMERWKDVILKILQEEIPLKGIYEKMDAEWRKIEGLKGKPGLLWGAEPPDELEILENGLKFLVDIKHGQKTGFFLDQRENRKLVGEHSRGKKLLNCFSYSAGFSVYGARGGALSTVSVDSSDTALNLASKNLTLNGFSEKDHRCLHTDVFQYLRQGNEPFDFIVLDPPAFCQSKAHVDNASRAYKDVNMIAMKRLSEGGLLFTASCSSFISVDLFQKILFGAAKDTGKNIRILAKTGHPFDHPVNIYFPEGEYLKGFLCRVE